MPAERGQTAGDSQVELMEAALALRYGHAGHPTRTSPSQFEMMVTFMEKHGDLSKPQLRTKSRSEQIQAWEQLRETLNADTADGHSCYPRSLDKWKKVWSDLKNNTKKKAQRLVSTSRPGAGFARPGAPAPAGSPAQSPPRLSQLEFRVLKLMGMVRKTIPASLQRTPAANPSEGMVLEVPAPAALVPAPSSPEPLQHDSEVFELTFEAWGRRMTQDPLTEPKSEKSTDLADDSFSWPKAPSPSPAEYMVMPEHETMSEDGTNPAEVPGAEQTFPPRPDDRGHTNSRGVRFRKRSANKTFERAASLFLESAAHWRRRDAQHERARLRLRADELKVQQQWQRICERGLLVMERFLEQRELRAPSPAAPSVADEADQWSEASPSHEPMVLNPDRDN